MYGRLALFFIGLSSGGVIAAGIFAFLAIIGVFPRLMGATHTKGHVILYETMLILGGTAGNLMDLFQWPLAGRFSWLCGGLPPECSWGAW